MASSEETGWQSEKTLAECVQYMFDNEIAIDVCFEVGPSEGDIVNIKAHKFMLISRSPVFEAMFTSKMSETKSESEAKIRIVDIDAEAFKLLLRFIYCDSVSIDFGSAQMLLYASKKYMLPRLTQLCSTYLQSILSAKNVCDILELSLTFDVEDLKSRCLGFAADHSETVLNGNEILTLSRPCFEAILKMDRIMSDPSTVFRGCVKWAKHQLESQSVEAPTDQQVRETLGSLLYEIRLPTISVTTFANLVGESEVLTSEEKSAVYYYLLSKKGKDKLKFSTVNTHELLINRSTTSIKGLWSPSKCSSCNSIKKSSFEINFQTDKSILLTGLGLYTGHNGSKYDADIAIKQKDISLLQKNLTVPSAEDLHIFKFSFDKFIAILPYMEYSISALAYQAIGYIGDECPRLPPVGNVTFTIYSVCTYNCQTCRSSQVFRISNAEPGRGTCSSCGKWQQLGNCADRKIQIPHLYFIPVIR